jgi:TRAP-type uncharacterized transport system substrate-binding protein
MATTIRLSTMENGGQWWKSITWAGEAIKNAGLDVDITRYGTGAREPLMRVAEGVSDIGISLATGAAQASRGLGDYKEGGVLPIRGLTRLIRPNQHYFNMVRADVGIRSFAEIADRKPKLDFSLSGSPGSAGNVAEITLKHYGVDLYRDIKAWGGSMQGSHPKTTMLAVEGKCNAIMRPDTIYGPAGIVSQLAPWVLLPLDEDIAGKLERECCTPVVTIPSGTLKGQTEPCLAVTNPGFELMINKDLPDDIAYLLAKALNESSTRHYAAQDVFYSIRYAPETSAPLHPGAARYYKEQGVLK